MTDQKQKEKFEAKLKYYQDKLDGYYRSVKPEVLADPENTFNMMVIGECKYKVKFYKECVEAFSK